MNIHEDDFRINLFNEWKLIAEKNPYGCIECDNPNAVACEGKLCVNGE